MNVTTFKKFLQEEQSSERPEEHRSRVKSIDVDSAIAWMNHHSPNFLKSGAKLFRGMYSNVEHGLAAGSSAGAQPRRSANTSNYYTLWMDNNPMFDGWPKRSQSFICTTQKSYADGFGQSYIMVPSDNAKVGSVGAFDLWDVNLYDDLHPHYLNDYVDMYVDGSIDTYEQLVKGLKGVHVDDVSARLQGPLRSLNCETLYDFYEKVLTPEKFDGTFKAGDFKKDAKGECWVEGDAIFIPTAQEAVTADDQEELMQWAEDYPAFRRLLKSLWVETPEDASYNDGSIHDIDPDTVSDEDVLTSQQNKQR